MENGNKAIKWQRRIIVKNAGRVSSNFIWRKIKKEDAK